LVVLLPEIADAIRNPAIMGPGAASPEASIEAQIESSQQDEPQAQDPE
jgi:chemotaxis protein MotB